MLQPTATTLWPANTPTFLGSSWFDRSSPWPNRPKYPSPQLQTAPSAVTAMLCSCPADTARTRGRAYDAFILDAKFGTLLEDWQLQVEEALQPLVRLYGSDEVRESLGWESVVSLLKMFGAMVAPSRSREKTDRGQGGWPLPARLGAILGATHQVRVPAGRRPRPAGGCGNAGAGRDQAR